MYAVSTRPIESSSESVSPDFKLVSIILVMSSDAVRDGISHFV